MELNRVWDGKLSRVEVEWKNGMGRGSASKYLMACGIKIYVMRCEKRNAVK